MNQKMWNDVDAYFESRLVGRDAALEGALAASAAAGLPPIAVAPNQGKFLYLLARMIKARRILEIGTLGGYSAIWLARALPNDGRLISLELDPKHAQVARSNLTSAGLSKVAEVRVGAAIESLPILEGGELFDMVFIDADKASMPDYFIWSLKLTHRGSVIVFDNVVRGGAVIDPGSEDENVRGVQRLHEMLATEKRVTATTLQTVGVKGYDGFTMAVVE
jgi:predicted O-methyltransferase YrrM